MSERKRPPSLSAGEYRKIIRDLVALYERQPGIETWQRERRHVLALAGLEQEVIACAHAEAVLAKAQQYDAGAIHVRKALEFAIVAQWIHVTPDGLSSFEYKSQKSTTALLKEAAKANMWIPEDLAEVFLVPATTGPDDLKAMGTFQRVADTFGEGGGIYLMYRSLSGECHPNLGAVVKHLEEDAHASGGVAIRLTGGVERASWLFTLAASLLWVARPIDDRTMFKPRKRQLQTIARRLGIPSQLKPVA